MVSKKQARRLGADMVGCVIAPGTSPVPTPTLNHAIASTFNHVLALVLTLLLALSLASCALPNVEREVSLGELLPQSTPLAQELTASLDTMQSQVWEQGFSAYVADRRIDIAPSREPYNQGSWTSHVDEALTEAPADGSIAEWREHYYITHNWSAAGLTILDMVVGDTLSLDGAELVATQVFNYPKLAYYEEMRWIVGDDTYVLQTCVPDSTYNRIVVTEPTN